MGLTEPAVPQPPAHELYTSNTLLSVVVSAILQPMCTTPHTATVRMAGAMEKSSDVMKAMQSLMKVGEVRETMMALSKEMSKVGLVGSLLLHLMQVLLHLVYLLHHHMFVLLHLVCCTCVLCVCVCVCVCVCIHSYHSHTVCLLVLHSTHCGTGSLTVIEYDSKDGSLPFPLTVTGHMVLS